MLLILLIVIIVIVLVTSKSSTTAKDIEESSKYQELTDWQKAQLMYNRPRVTLTLPCPRCGHVLMQGMCYCPKCGQKADWSVYNKPAAPKAEEKTEKKTESPPL